MTAQDAHQLREAYQQYHAAFARMIRAERNYENFRKGPATWMDDEGLRQGWNLTYLVGQNEDDLNSVMTDARTVKASMEARLKSQLEQLVKQRVLPELTHIDDLSPCIMRKIYPSHFPDQPAVSLLLRLRGGLPAGDWPELTPNTTEPPKGKGPDVVSAFLARAAACSKVAPAELIVMLSGQEAMQQATTWAWQSWTTDGFVVPMLDMVDREAHALNRMAAVARGQILVALRTDTADVSQLLTEEAHGGSKEPNCGWLQRVLTLYHRIPQLGAMTHGRYSFSHPAAADQLRELARGGSGPEKNNEFFKEPTTSVPFQYVLYGDYMPMSFRKSAMDEIGGFDEDLPQGDGTCSDVIRWDLSWRMWKSGWRVGAHDTGLLQRPAPPPATPAANSDPTRCSPDVSALAAKLFEARHTAPPAAGQPVAAEVLMARVRELNMQGLAPLRDDALAQCPMAQGCNKA